MPKRIKFVEERIASRFIAHLARLCSQCWPIDAKENKVRRGKDCESFYSLWH